MRRVENFLGLDVGPIATGGEICRVEAGRPKLAVHGAGGQGAATGTTAPHVPGPSADPEPWASEPVRKAPALPRP